MINGQEKTMEKESGAKNKGNSAFVVWRVQSLKLDRCFQIEKCIDKQEAFH